MPEFLANFSNQITEYWGRFSNRQRIQIISIFAAALIALVVLAVVLSRPDYVLYAEDVSPTEMNTIVETLTSNNIAYRYEDNASSLYVESGRFQDVRLLLAQAGVLSEGGFEWADAFNSSFTTTSGERDMMQQLAFESEINETLEMLDAVQEAKVKFVLPDDRNYVLEADKEASASVILTLADDLSDEQVTGIAAYISDLVDNLSTANIKILESRTSTLLYNGGNSSSVVGSVNAYLEIQNLYEDKFEKELEILLFNSGGIDDAIVDVNLVIDFDSVQVDRETHTLPADSPTSLPTRVYIYESTGSSTDGAGIPGTDSNTDATTYVVDNGGGSDSSVTINETDYAVDTTVERRAKAEGEIVHEESSVSVVIRSYNVHRQALLEEAGELENITWEQYKVDNDIETELPVDQNIIDFVANAALIDNVSIRAFEVAVFEDSPPVDNQVADYIPVVIIVLMIAMLGYAVYRGTEPVEITEVEPELSVEEMLATTTSVGQELDEIEFSDKSEARVQIERFVDENPEAVAQLLRNWLNEDWE